MLLGALLAAGAPADWLRVLPARLGLDGVSVEVRPVDRCGIRSVKVDVVLPGGEREGPAALYSDPAQQHGPEHVEHGHHHRHIGQLIATIEGAPLSAWVRERAVRAIRMLGEAEGRVHGLPAEQVALHEVGAADALVDIVGAIEGFEQLGITRVYHRAVAVGSGWVHAAHGTMSVPAPATAILLEGIELAPNGPVVGEATTPTGAVLLRVLSSGAPPSHWRAVDAGAWGAGGRNPRDYPNALRLIVAESVAEAGEIVSFATDIDDMNPEYLEPLRQALVEAGALDVQVWATQMKKGRAGFRIEATASPECEAAVTAAFFGHSSTAGVRRQRQQRVTLPRREVTIEAEDGSPVRVKVLDGPAGMRIKPEYEDVAGVAQRTGRPAHEVAKDLHLRALRLLNPLSAPRV